MRGGEATRGEWGPGPLNTKSNRRPIYRVLPLSHSLSLYSSCNDLRIPREFHPTVGPSSAQAQEAALLELGEELRLLG